RQFLLEALMLGAIGSMIGVAVGLGLPLLLRPFIQSVLIRVSGLSALLAFLFSCAVTLIFGVVPAYRAANLNPTEALHYEEPATRQPARRGPRPGRRLPGYRPGAPRRRADRAARCGARARARAGGRGLAGGGGRGALLGAALQGRAEAVRLDLDDARLLLGPPGAGRRAAAGDLRVRGPADSV